MKNRLWIGIALLVLASLACSIGGAGTEEGTTAPPSGEEPGTQPTEVPATEPPAGEEPALNVAPSALDGLDSYRLRMTWDWQPDAGTAETMVIEMEATRDPAAQRISMGAGTESAFEMVQIGDTYWTCMAGTCAQTEATEDMTSEFGSEIDFDPSTYTSGTDYDYLGEENVNGLNARHYRLNLTPAEMIALAQGEASDVQADIWVASQSGLPEFVTRFTMTWREDRSGTLGSASMMFDVYDVNAPFTIEPPEGAAGMPEGLPEYPGATALTIMEGLISFNTTDDLAAVADFYRNQLPANGWTSQSDQEMGTLIMQTWSDGTRTLSIMISPGQEGGSSVVITLE